MFKHRAIATSWPDNVGAIEINAIASKHADPTPLLPLDFIVDLIVCLEMISSAETASESRELDQIAEHCPDDQQI